MKFALTKLFAAGLLIVSGSSVAVASVPERADDGRVKVSFADLDIASDAGARVLYGRLKMAARQACGVGSYRELGLSSMMKAKACYREVLDDVVDRIDSDALHEIHNG